MARALKRRTTTEQTTEPEEKEASQRRHPASRPAGRTDSRRPAGRTSAGASGGWDALRNQAKASAGFADTFKVGSDEIVFKFAQTEPFAVFAWHWLEQAQGKKGFVCHAEDCPLCEQLGDSPRTQVLFNVIEMPYRDSNGNDVGEPEMKIWACGVRLAEKIRTLSQNTKTSPIDRDDLYWSVSRSGKGTKTEYNLVPIKERDLVAEWAVTPLAEEDLAELREAVHGFENYTKTDSREDLEELVDELT
ncbi:hypothetical protein ACFWYW_24055 [Nonomuraea sp. NPDC059023]|uniref:hypothetical protein n=1 Tax=unclassified Nonomuraea TaxID=2593643 RepID=UPI0036A6D045